MLNQKQVAQIKKEYPVGTKIRLIEMDDKFAPPKGTVGTVAFVDDAGQIHMKWSNGSSLALVPDVDDFVKI